MDHYQTTQDDLARLFQHNLTLSHSGPTPTSSPSSVSSSITSYSSVSSSSSAPIYASTHYHSPVSPIPPADIHLLESANINPSFLFPSQLALFASSSPATRHALLTMWRSAPIRAHDKDLIRYRYGELLSTDLLAEEVMARLRMGRDLAESRVVASTERKEYGGGAEPYMLDGYGVGGQQAGESQAERSARDFERLQALHSRVSGLAGDADKMVL